MASREPSYRSEKTVVLDCNQAGEGSSPGPTNSVWRQVFSEGIILDGSRPLVLAHESSALPVPDAGATAVYGPDAPVYLEEDMVIDVTIAPFIFGVGGDTKFENSVYSSTSTLPKAPGDSSSGGWRATAPFRCYIKNKDDGTVLRANVQGTIPAGQYTRQTLVDSLNDIFIRDYTSADYAASFTTDSQGGTQWIVPADGGNRPATLFRAWGRDRDDPLYVAVPVNLSAAERGAGGSNYTAAELGEISWGDRYIIAGGTKTPFVLDSGGSRVTLQYTYQPILDDDGNESILLDDSQGVLSGEDPEIIPRFACTGWCILDTGVAEEDWESADNLFYMLGFSRDQLDPNSVQGAQTAVARFEDAYITNTFPTMGSPEFVSGATNLVSSSPDLVADTGLENKGIVQAFPPEGVRAQGPILFPQGEQAPLYLIEAVLEGTAGQADSWNTSEGSLGSGIVAVATRAYAANGFIYGQPFSPVTIPPIAGLSDVEGGGAVKNVVVKAVKIRILHSAGRDARTGGVGTKKALTPLTNSELGPGSSVVLTLRAL